MKIIKKFDIYIVSLILVLIDQFSKYFVIENLEYISKLNIFGVVKFTYCENRGVAFSFGSGSLSFFILLNVFIILGICIFYEINKLKFKKCNRFLFSFVIAGGLGNLIDRICRGFVVDFIDVNQVVRFAIFNIADVFICVGIVGLILYYLNVFNFFRKEL